MPKTIKKRNQKVSKPKVNSRKVAKKTKTTKTVRKYKPRKQKTPKNKMLQKPIVLYSKDPITGQETLATADMSNKDGLQTYMATVESKIPPTMYQRNNGTGYMSMSEKRAVVVQRYKNMSN
jgi:hypothetical protein